jgi:hypothetical protein
MKQAAIHENHQSKIDVRLDVQRNLISSAQSVADACDYLKHERSLVISLLSCRKNEAKTRKFISVIYEEIKNDKELSNRPALASLLMDTCNGLDHWFGEDDYISIVDTLTTEVDEVIERYFPEIRRPDKTYCWRKPQLSVIYARLMRLELYVAFIEFICSDNLKAIIDISPDKRTALEYTCDTLARMEGSLSEMVTGLNNFDSSHETTNIELSLISAQNIQTAAIVKLMRAVLIVSSLTFVTAVVELVLMNIR